MTLTKSDVSELLDAIRAGGDIDVIRALLHRRRRCAAAGLASGVRSSAPGGALAPGARVPAGCVGGGGLAVTPDNRFVVATIMGRDAGQTSTPIGPTRDTRPFPGMVVLLDVAALVTSGGSDR